MNIRLFGGLLLLILIAIQLSGLASVSAWWFVLAFVLFFLQAFIGLTLIVVGGVVFVFASLAEWILDRRR